MNYKVTALAVMTAVVGLLSSCMKSDDETVIYDDVLITSFSLGNVKCEKTITKSNGKDSTYTYTYSASSFPMSIDQINNQIFNVDSLVKGTKVERVLTTIATKNDGVVMIKRLGTTDTWDYYSSSDSIDYYADGTFTRTFRVYSSDGQHQRDYSVKVNIANFAEDAGTWENTVYTQQLTDKYRNISSAVMYGNLMYVTMMGDNNNVSVYASKDGNTWLEKTTPANCDTAIVCANGKLYMKDKANNLLESSDSAKTWSSVNTGESLKTIIGGSDSCLFAVNANQKIIRLKRNATEFTVDSIESQEYFNVTKYLPYKDVNIMYVGTNTNPGDLTRFVVVANPDPTKMTESGDTTAVIWNKIEDLSDPREVLPWYKTAFNPFNKKYVLPIMEGLTTAYFNKDIFAMGKKTAYGMYSQAESFSKIYYSPDYGATWHADDSTIPELPSQYTTTNLVSVKLVANTEGDKLYLIALYNEAGQSTLKVWKAILHKTASSNYYFK